MYSVYVSLAHYLHSTKFLNYCCVHAWIMYGCSISCAWVYDAVLENETCPGVNQQLWPPPPAPPPDAAMETSDVVQLGGRRHLSSIEEPGFHASADASGTAVFRWVSATWQTLSAAIPSMKGALSRVGGSSDRILPSEALSVSKAVEVAGGLSNGFVSKWSLVSGGPELRAAARTSQSRHRPIVYNSSITGLGHDLISNKTLRLEGFVAMPSRNTTVVPAKVGGGSQIGVGMGEDKGLQATRDRGNRPSSALVPAALSNKSEPFSGIMSSCDACLRGSTSARQILQLTSTRTRTAPPPSSGKVCTYGDPFQKPGAGGCCEACRQAAKVYTHYRDSDLDPSEFLLLMLVV
jgi:hypothetical protein